MEDFSFNLFRYKMEILIQNRFASDFCAKYNHIKTMSPENIFLFCI